MGPRFQEQTREPRNRGYLCRSVDPHPRAPLRKGGQNLRKGSTILFAALRAARAG